MRIQLFVEREPVADGGAFVRAALHLEGALGARDVTVRVRPGSDSEYGHVVHRAKSASIGRTLSVRFGALRDGQPARVRVEFLVRPDIAPGAEADVVRITVRGDVRTDDGGEARETVIFPVRLGLDGVPRAVARVRRRVTSSGTARRQRSSSA
jgi:hypothetical protein